MTDQLTTASAARAFTIGGCLGTSLAVFARNFGPLAVLGLILSLPNLAFSLYEPGGTVDLTKSSASEIWTLIGGAVIAIFVNALISAAVIYGSFQDLRGARASFGDCLSRGLASVLPVGIASILGTLAIGFASILLIIPGIIVAMMLWVYIPAIVVEGQGITASFGRSAELTKGRRWQILGLVLVVAIAAGIAQFVVGLFLPIISLGSIYIPLIILFAVQALASIFNAITTAVGYYQLRAEKEGVEIDDIAKVFD